MTTKRVAVALVTFMALALTFLMSPAANAQVVGATLSGKVTDPSGSAIANAQLSIKNIATGVTQTVTTDSAGFYAAPNLLPGTYSVTFSAPGFSTVVESNVVLAVGDERALDRAMQVGEVNQTVQVTAEVEGVQLASSAIGGEVNGTTVRELPLNGRDWTSLAVLQPGVTTVRTQPSSGSTTLSRAVRGFGNMMSDSGHRPEDNSFRVNGVSVVDYENDSPGSVTGGALGVDAIAEFGVLTTNYSAEYGRAGGAIITAITRSGTNAFHGNAYWFLRDEGLDARNFFDPVNIPPFHRNNFGASVGGPIIKDRTFFFFDYEGIRQDQSLSFSDTVPSMSARAGNLCSIPTGVTPACTPTTIAVSPLVAPFLPLYPLPNAGLIGDGDTGTFLISGLATVSENYETLRIDHKISEKDSLAGSWFQDSGPYSFPDALVETNNLNSVFREMFSVEETHIFSPRLLNTARFGFNRDVVNANTPGQVFNPLAADPTLGSLPDRNVAILTVPGLTQMAGGSGSAAEGTNKFDSFQFYDDAFLTIGTHSLKFGGDFEHIRWNTVSTGKANGTWTFPSLQGFLLDQPTSFQFSFSPQPDRPRQNVGAVYFEDDWHVRPNLTLNLGLRYEPASIPTEANNLFQSIVTLTEGPFGLMPCCDGSVPVHTLWHSNSTLHDFDPRIGFSWDPFRNGKTAVRGGFGIYDTLPLTWVISGGSTSTYPFNANVLQKGLAAGAFPTAGVVIPDSLNQKALANRYVEQDPGRSYTMTWNLNIQREFAPSLTGMVGYVGSRSVHQPNTPNDVDMVLPTLTSAGYLWPFPVGSGTEFNQNVSSIVSTTWQGTSSYSGLQAQLTKKMSHGLQAQLAYTWSKCIDDGSAGALANVFANSLTSFNWVDRASYTGLCDFNIGQNLVLNYVWVAPSPKLGNAVASYVLGGWEVSGIFSASTGSPFSVLIGGDPLGMKGITNAFPDRVAGCNPYNKNFGATNLHYLNTTCFTPPVVPSDFPSYATMCQPAAASVAAVIPFTCMNLFGDAGRNQLNGPGFTDFDFSLIKNNPVRKISDSFNIQFRAEFFNVFNHPNFQSPLDQTVLLNQNGTPVSSGGLVDATSNTSRQIQFGLKVIW